MLAVWPQVRRLEPFLVSGGAGAGCSPDRSRSSAESEEGVGTVFVVELPRAIDLAVG